ncbi:MAG TPA: hypothetical protein VGS19_27140 [Streptosporangiaceae bacterium]|nr:hypothetical protein [Streptosporangiaceae bacterium]
MMRVISPVAFSTDDREGVVRYALAVEVPSRAAHCEHDAGPGSQEFNRLTGLLQPANPLA